MGIEPAVHAPPAALSLTERLLALAPAERAEVLASLEPAEAARVLYDFDLWALPHQRIPRDASWSVVLMLTGRGVGKTRTIAEEVRRRAEAGSAPIALVGPTAADVRDVMIEGESGILAVAPPWARPRYYPSKRRLEWPNGVRAFAYSAEEPERLRGPQHGFAACDELGAWKYLDATWDNLMLGLRLGEHPQALAATTPRPRPLIRSLVERGGHGVEVIRATIRDNPYLPEAFVAEMMARYAGTRIGQQELEGILLEDVEGALWQASMIEVIEPAQLERIVVGLDPSGSIRGDDVGIVTAARTSAQTASVIRDASGHYSPEGWARKAIDEALAAEADCIVAESNFGGDMVRSTIMAQARSMGVACPRIKLVTASRGKQVRAEPVVALYEQGKVTHAAAFGYLVDQMLTWVPGEGASPGAVDALVWALTDLLIASPTAPATLANPAKRAAGRLGRGARLASPR